jgi:hypothetical protein
MPHDHDPLHTLIHARLGQIAASAPPAWRAAWARLGQNSSEEERLAVYRAVQYFLSPPYLQAKKSIGPF